MTPMEPKRVSDHVARAVARVIDASLAHYLGAAAAWFAAGRAALGASS
jgi:hypothetical protein